MGWIEKDKPSPLDDQPIEGLFWLDGDVMARFVNRDWTKGYKLPLIAFPSGEEFEIWPSSNPEIIGIVHLFGELDLSLKGHNRASAFEHAFDVAEQCGYAVYPVGEDQLEVWGHDVDEHYLLTFDNEARLIANVEPVKEEKVEPEPLFELGQVVATPGAIAALQEAQQDPVGLLLRHVTGDWGDLDEEDVKENQLSVEKGFRILSAYPLETGVKVWVITEADRSATTFLLPSEY
jgi:hypothetical protein